MVFESMNSENLGGISEPQYASPKCSYPATIGVGFHTTTYVSKAKTWLNFLDVSESLLQQLFCVAMVPSCLGARTGDYMSIYHLI